ncbi:MAG: hypothetical protein EBZ59_09280 [Planctomycetia bacterium]|nr:hypothetical protein [Planctomycetia bacterium]
MTEFEIHIKLGDIDADDRDLRRVIESRRVYESTPNPGLTSGYSRWTVANALADVLLDVTRKRFDCEDAAEMLWAAIERIEDIRAKPFTGVLGLVMESYREQLAQRSKEWNAPRGGSEPTP